MKSLFIIIWCLLVPTTLTAGPTYYVAPTCSPGKAYPNPLNCCCGKVKGVTRTKWITRTERNLATTQVTPQKVTKKQAREDLESRQDIGVEHLCPRCPSKSSPKRPPAPFAKGTYCCPGATTVTITKTSSKKSTSTKIVTTSTKIVTSKTTTTKTIVPTGTLYGYVAPTRISCKTRPASGYTGVVMASPLPRGFSMSPTIYAPKNVNRPWICTVSGNVSITLGSPANGGTISLQGPVTLTANHSSLTNTDNFYLKTAYIAVGLDIREEFNVLISSDTTVSSKRAVGKGVTVTIRHFFSSFTPGFLLKNEPIYGGIASANPSLLTALGFTQATLNQRFRLADYTYTASSSNSGTLSPASFLFNNLNRIIAPGAAGVSDGVNGSVSLKGNQWTPQGVSNSLVFSTRDGGILWGYPTSKRVIACKQPFGKADVTFYGVPFISFGTNGIIQGGVSQIKCTANQISSWSATWRFDNTTLSTAALYINNNGNLISETVTIRQFHLVYSSKTGIYNMSFGASHSNIWATLTASLQSGVNQKDIIISLTSEVRRGDNPNLMAPLPVFQLQTIPLSNLLHAVSSSCLSDTFEHTILVLLPKILYTTASKSVFLSGKTVLGKLPGQLQFQCPTDSTSAPIRLFSHDLLDGVSSQSVGTVEITVGRQLCDFDHASNYALPRLPHQTIVARDKTIHKVFSGNLSGIAVAKYISDAQKNPINVNIIGQTDCLDVYLYDSVQQFCEPEVKFELLGSVVNVTLKTLSQSTLVMYIPTAVALYASNPLPFWRVVGLATSADLQASAVEALGSQAAADAIMGAIYEMSSSFVEAAFNDPSTTTNVSYGYFQDSGRSTSLKKRNVATLNNRVFFDATYKNRLYSKSLDYHLYTDSFGYTHRKARIALGAPPSIAPDPSFAGITLEYALNGAVFAFDYANGFDLCPFTTATINTTFSNVPNLGSFSYPNITSYFVCQNEQMEPVGLSVMGLQPVLTDFPMTLFNSSFQFMTYPDAFNCSTTSDDATGTGSNTYVWTGAQNLNATVGPNGTNSSFTLQSSGTSTFAQGAQNVNTSLNTNNASYGGNSLIDVYPNLTYAAPQPGPEPNGYQPSVFQAAFLTGISPVSLPMPSFLCGLYQQGTSILDDSTVTVAMAGYLMPPALNGISIGYGIFQQFFNDSPAIILESWVMVNMSQYGLAVINLGSVQPSNWCNLPLQIGTWFEGLPQGHSTNDGSATLLMTCDATLQTALTFTLTLSVSLGSLAMFLPAQGSCTRCVPSVSIFKVLEWDNLYGIWGYHTVANGQNLALSWNPSMQSTYSYSYPWTFVMSPVSPTQQHPLVPVIEYDITPSTASNMTVQKLAVISLPAPWQNVVQIPIGSLLEVEWGNTFWGGAFNPHALLGDYILSMAMETETSIQYLNLQATTPFSFPGMQIVNAFNMTISYTAAYNFPITTDTITPGLWGLDAPLSKSQSFIIFGQSAYGNNITLKSQYGVCGTTCFFDCPFVYDWIGTGKLNIASPLLVPGLIDPIVGQSIPQVTVQCLGNGSPIDGAVPFSVAWNLTIPTLNVSLFGDFAVMQNAQMVYTAASTASLIVTGSFGTTTAVLSYSFSGDGITLVSVVMTANQNTNPIDANFPFSQYWTSSLQNASLFLFNNDPEMELVSIIATDFVNGQANWNITGYLPYGSSNSTVLAKLFAQVSSVNGTQTGTELFQFADPNDFVTVSLDSGSICNAGVMYGFVEVGIVGTGAPLQAIASSPNASCVFACDPTNSIVLTYSCEFSYTNMNLLFYGASSPLLAGSANFSSRDQTFSVRGMNASSIGTILIDAVLNLNNVLESTLAVSALNSASGFTWSQVPFSGQNGSRAQSSTGLTYLFNLVGGAASQMIGQSLQNIALDFEGNNPSPVPPTTTSSQTFTVTTTTTVATSSTTKTTSTSSKLDCMSSGGSCWCPFGTINHSCQQGTIGQYTGINWDQCSDYCAKNVNCDYFAMSEILQCYLYGKTCTLESNSMFQVYERTTCSLRRSAPSRMHTRQAPIASLSFIANLVDSAQGISFTESSQGGSWSLGSVTYYSLMQTSGVWAWLGVAGSCVNNAAPISVTALYRNVTGLPYWVKTTGSTSNYICQGGKFDIQSLQTNVNGITTLSALEDVVSITAANFFYTSNSVFMNGSVASTSLTSMPVGQSFIVNATIVTTLDLVGVPLSIGYLGLSNSTIFAPYVPFSQFVNNTLNNASANVITQDATFISPTMLFSIQSSTSVKSAKRQLKGMLQQLSINGNMTQQNVTSATQVVLQGNSGAWEPLLCVNWNECSQLVLPFGRFMEFRISTASTCAAGPLSTTIYFDFAPQLVLPTTAIGTTQFICNSTTSYSSFITTFEANLGVIALNSTLNSTGIFTYDSSLKTGVFLSNYSSRITVQYSLDLQGAWSVGYVQGVNASAVSFGDLPWHHAFSSLATSAVPELDQAPVTRAVFLQATMGGFEQVIQNLSFTCNIPYPLSDTSVANVDLLWLSSPIAAGWVLMEDVVTTVVSGFQYADFLISATLACEAPSIQTPYFNAQASVTAKFRDLPYGIEIPPVTGLIKFVCYGTSLSNLKINYTDYTVYVTLDETYAVHFAGDSIGIANITILYNGVSGNYSLRARPADLSFSVPTGFSLDFGWGYDLNWPSFSIGPLFSDFSLSFPDIFAWICELLPNFSLQFPGFDISFNFPSLTAPVIDILDDILDVVLTGFNIVFQGLTMALDGLVMFWGIEAYFFYLAVKDLVSLFWNLDYGINLCSESKCSLDIQWPGSLSVLDPFSNLLCWGYTNLLMVNKPGPYTVQGMEIYAAQAGFTFSGVTPVSCTIIGEVIDVSGLFGSDVTNTVDSGQLDWSLTLTTTQASLAIALSQPLSGGGSSYLDCYLQVSTAMSGLAMSFGFSFVFDTTLGGNPMDFIGGILIQIDDTGGEFIGYFGFNGVWENPFGIMPALTIYQIYLQMGLNVETLLPVSLEMAINATLSGGIAVDGELYINPANTASSFAIYLNIDNAALGTIVSDFCPFSVDSSITNVLNGLSLQAGNFSFNPSDVEVQFAPHQPAILPGLFVNVINLNLWNILMINQATLYTSGKTMYGVLLMQPIDFNPVFSVTSVTSTSQGPNGNFYLDPKHLSFYFNGYTQLFGMFSAAVLVNCSTSNSATNFYVNGNITFLGDSLDISMSQTSGGGIMAYWEFKLYAQMLAPKQTGFFGQIFISFTNWIEAWLNNYYNQMSAAVNEVADESIEASQSAVNSAQQALATVEQNADAAIRSAQDHVDSAQSTVDSLNSKCRHYKHECSWYEPWYCAAYGGCELALVSAQGALYAAEKILAAVEAAMDAAINAAQASLQAAENALTATILAMQQLVDSVLAAVNDVIDQILSGLASIMGKIIFFDELLLEAVYGTASQVLFSAGIHIGFFGSNPQWYGFTFDFSNPITSVMNTIQNVCPPFLQNYMNTALSGTPAGQFTSDITTAL
jgi:hypothetical protein